MRYPSLVLPPSFDHAKVVELIMTGGDGRTGEPTPTRTPPVYSVCVPVSRELVAYVRCPRWTPPYVFLLGVCWYEPVFRVSEHIWGVCGGI